MTATEHLPQAIPGFGTPSEGRVQTASCTCGWLGGTFTEATFGWPEARTVAMLAAQRHAERAEAQTVLCRHVFVTDVGSSYWCQLPVGHEGGHEGRSEVVTWGHGSIRGIDGPRTAAERWARWARHAAAPWSARGDGSDLSSRPSRRPR